MRTNVKNISEAELCVSVRWSTDLSESAESGGRVLQRGRWHHAEQLQSGGAHCLTAKRCQHAFIFCLYMWSAHSKNKCFGLNQGYYSWLRSCYMSPFSNNILGVHWYKKKKTLSSSCKPQKCKFVKTVTSCAMCIHITCSVRRRAYACGVSLQN